MKHFLVTPKDLQRLHDYYKSQNYIPFFRHFPKNLPLTTFIQATKLFGGFFKIVDEEKTLSYIFATVNPLLKTVYPGILVPNKYSNKGNALKSMQYLMKECFKDPNIEQALAVVSSDEPRVNKLLKASIFTLDSVLTNNCIYNNKYHNENRYILTKETYNNQYNKDK